jgi:FkbM family methyltransferase
MREWFAKTAVRRVFFRPGAVRTIKFGPLAGMTYRVSRVTGMAPWYSGGQWEHQRVFQRILRQGDIAFDVGANWGMHTLLFSRLVGASGFVNSFECLPEAQNELLWHIERNRISNVLVHHKAVADYDGEASFLFGENTSTGCLAPTAQGQTISVTVCRLDSLLEDIERLRLIKIDVEGAESRVLHGAERITERFRPYYVVDLHTPEEDFAVAKWLRERSYRIERIGGGPPIKNFDLGWPHPEGIWGDILAIPE